MIQLYARRSLSIVINCIFEPIKPGNLLSIFAFKCHRQSSLSTSIPATVSVSLDVKSD